MKNPKAILFDLGGVLCELRGESHMMKLLGGLCTREQMWRAWLASPAVRAHESGMLSETEFARQVIAEFERGLIFDGGLFVTAQARQGDAEIRTRFDGIWLGREEGAVLANGRVHVTRLVRFESILQAWIDSLESGGNQDLKQEGHSTIVGPLNGKRAPFPWFGRGARKRFDLEVELQG